MTTLTVIKTPEGDERLEQLKEIHAMVEKGMHTMESIELKLKEYSIIANMHINKQLENPSYFDNQQYLCEYFMGQILYIINNQVWYTMNSLLTVIYGYLERVKEEELYA